MIAPVLVALATAAPPTLYAPDRVEAELADLARRHPDVLRVERYGTSALGRPLLMARLGSGAADRRRPVVFALFGQHPDEHDMNALGMDFVRRFLDPEARGIPGTALLNRAEVAIVPMANPDGTNYDLHVAARPFEWRRNRRARGKAIGTNLNANWGGAWKAGEPAGEQAFSEPETRAIRDWLAPRRVTGFFDFHSGTSGFNQGMVLVPEDAPAPPAAATLARYMSLPGDTREPYWVLPPSAVRARLAEAMTKHVPEPHRARALASLPADTRAWGSTLGWAPGALRCPAFGLEISRAFDAPDAAGYARALETDYEARAPRLFEAFVAGALAVTE